MIYIRHPINQTKASPKLQAPTTNVQRKIMETITSHYSSSLLLALKEKKIEGNDIIKSFVTHVFLPKNLPQSVEPFEEDISKALLSLLASFTKEFLLGDNASTPIQRTINGMSKWTSLQNDLRGTFKLNEELDHLPVGESIPLYVRKQNCTIIFTRLDECHLRVMTFRASLPNEIIMGTAGSLQVSYPETVEIIPISELLLSPTFSKHVQKLSFETCSLAMPVSQKGDNQFAESRQVSYPFIISEFMIGMLQPIATTDFNESMKQCASLKLSKKVRDEVNWSNCTIPFRRSGLWMSAKVVLHLSLLEELGNDDEARLAYKIILLEMIVELCKYFVQENSHNWDIISQMMVKLARRARKLSELPNPTNRFETERELVLQRTFNTIEKLHEMSQADWEKVQFAPDSDIEQIHLTEEEIRRDIQHDMTSLNQYLAKPRLPNESTDAINLTELNITRYSTLSSLLECKNSLRNDVGDIHMNPTTIWIHDVELFTRTNLDCLTASSADVHELFYAYTKQVVKLYAEEYCDPVSFSRMILTTLKMIRVLDEIATRTHPLLKKYRSGIDPKMFDNLILPKKHEDMEMLESLVDYFSSRNEAADFPSIIQNRFLSSTDFSVQYAQQSREMTQLKEDILAATLKAIEKKYEEVQNAEERCQTLQAQINRLNCEYVWDGFYQENLHSSSCERCRLKSQLEYKRTSVTYYQRPLPNFQTKEFLQDAVVFELLIPEEIAHLRNCLVTFLGEIYTHQLFEGVTNENIHVSWTSFPDLLQYHSLTNAAKAIAVKLGSTVKATMTSHYAKQNPDVVHTKKEAFILDNGLNCTFYFLPSLNIKISKSVLTFQLENALNCNPYKNLQLAMNSPRLTENEVIGLQYSCHEKLQLKEFISFGSMRMGHRIQLRSLYAALSNQSISLEQEPVLALILQTIWEVGPRTDEKLREIHADFYDQAFSMEFLELLEKILKSNATNWSCPMVMFAVTVLTIRILELNENHEVRELCAKLLKLARITLEDWWGKLETIILNSNAGNEASKDLEILNELRFQTAVCSAHTYNVCSEHLLKYVIVDDEDVVFWLSTVSRMYHMVVREKSHKNFSKLLQNLVRDARLRIPLNIESYIHEMVKKRGHNCFHNFCCRQWSPAFSAESWKWKQEIEASKHVYKGSYDIKNETGAVCATHSVFVDTVRGIFLVDGYPPSYLPENVILHPLFNRFFKHCRFQVQRDFKTFTTKNKYLDRHYQFYFTKESDLIIQEKTDNSWLELVPPQLLNKQVSNHFIEDFTHWFSHETNHVEFRNRSQDTVDYNFCPQRVILVERGANSRKIFSINSNGFQKIVNNLSRLEYKEFIDVVFEENAQTSKIILSANLRRLNLTFELKNSKLYSSNFPGYYIPSNQRFGTLTGLESGLLLEKETVRETSGYQKLFLIQHGVIEIQINDSNMKHQSVTVDSTALRKPPFFTFEIDPLLQRLKAGNDKSAWLYLAALHGSTSSPFQDAFTGLTGTEMAMWILQSGFIFSCSPYNAECLETLEVIRNLSPQRFYYPTHLQQMQTISWPSGFEHNSYAAYDGYGIIVDNLIACSNRLEELFPCVKEDNDEKEENATSSKLRERAYHRHLNNYNEEAHLGERFVSGHSHLIPHVITGVDSQKNPPREWMQVGKVRMDKNMHFIDGHKSIESFIITPELLPPHPCWPSEQDGKKQNFSCESLNYWFSKKMRKEWLLLYTLALQGEALEHEFTWILGALLYSERGSLEQALNLHNISRLVSTPSQNLFPSAVEFTTEFVPSAHNYVPIKISEIVRQAVKVFLSRESNYNNYTDYCQAKNQFEDKRNEQISLVERAPIRYWPSSKMDKYGLSSVGVVNEQYLDLNRIAKEVSRVFEFWFNNLQLKLFVDKVDLIIDGVRKTLLPMDVPSCHLQVCQLQLYAVLDDVDGVERLSAGIIRLSNPSTNIKSDYGVLQEVNDELQRRKYLRNIEEILEELRRFVCCSQISTALNHAGIHTRLAPVTLLRKLLEKDAKETKEEAYAKVYINALGTCISELSRLNRILHYRTSDIYSVELERELKTKPFEHWNPLQNPEWLLLELELNVTIRPIQVDVTKHMMNMEGGGVTQLNMGEGKTSVIVPMIVSTLSFREDLVCRVTVLSSIFNTNFNLLAFTIGGLLNKRLYTVPCRRDYKISECLQKIQETCKECMKLKGVIMTLPEYRLSFRLMLYNYYLQKKDDEAFQVYQIENWLRKHVCDIVDESDEIFSVKYQLIYTTGNQLKIGGGSMRWVVCQKLLQILPEVASKMLEVFGENAVEFDKEECDANPEQFTHFRILSKEHVRYFNELVAEVLLQGKIDLVNTILNEEKKELVKAFLIDENISEEDHNTVLEMDEIEEIIKEVLLIVSGYLRHGVLFTALTKRWRVELGVNEKGNKLMAVPFRAKDIAAERTEFGHPDMAIVLTQLSYYYSGLNDEQLFQVFFILKKMVGPESLFNGWIQKIPNEKSIDNSIKSYNGINLLDFEQRTKHLFPALRKHKAVIDFWLENCVYPKECKQFPRKLVMNAWDLSYEKQIHPTTGFSGTNDSKLLLPATISQKDLEALQKTNQDLETTLQRAENRCKRSLNMSDSPCGTILKWMKEDGLRVLIDAGALVLDGNETVAKLWLQKDSNLEGVVYFNDENELLIKTRSDYNEKSKQDTKLKLSSYNDRLDKCAVYLDDYHTRGTDLKLPNDFKACVTIGSRMRRDKLMQACMRMRKLGKGQSVHFYLSHEANNKILEMTDMKMETDEELSDFDSVPVSDILAWVKKNSKEFEEDGLVYWVASGKNYAQKLAADEMFEMSDKSKVEGEVLASRCEDEELLSLQDIYGTYRSKQNLVEIIPKWFSHVEQKLRQYGTSTTVLPENVQDSIDYYMSVVMRKCEENIPDKEFLFSMLEEEQEKELEPEQETEINVERPPFAEALKPKLHENVKLFVELGGQLYAKPGILRLSEVFKHTTFWKLIQPECWGSQVFVTEDFVDVIVNSSGGDSFLRSLSYVTSWSAPSSSNPVCILLLSPFEVNELMPLFQGLSGTAAVTLHMFSGRSMEGQDTLVNKARLQLPICRRGSVLSEDMMAPLLIVAGNLFYASMKEQKAFAHFLGLHPRPWGVEEEEAFENGLITGTGFVLPNNLSTMALRQKSLFQGDPTQMIRAILKCRNEVLRDSDHTIQILNQRAYLEEQEENEKDGTKSGE
ncbi:unnamed protein product [Orchesella dallaii]|uniref:ubiquitinyl hydrolase 1 n=1 Tax=Orchesella dallaii TaxID=48710 RepID=A0ABP1RF29_9HEXA